MNDPIRRHIANDRKPGGWAHPDGEPDKVAGRRRARKRLSRETRDDATDEATPMSDITPIVFLDVDGVLNSQEFICAATDDPFSNSNAHIDPVRCARVQRILDETGAQVVVSSAWRHLFDMPDLCAAFWRGGIDATRIIDKTPWVSSGHRGSEIECWLDNHRPDHETSGLRFVILDDNADMEPFMGRLVQTSMETGIEDKHVARAVEMLQPACATLPSAATGEVPDAWGHYHGQAHKDIARGRAARTVRRTER